MKNIKRILKTINKFVLKTISTGGNAVLNLAYNAAGENKVSIDNSFWFSKLRIHGVGNLVNLNSQCKHVDICINGNDNMISIVGDKLEGTKIDILGNNCHINIINMEYICNSRLLLKGENNTLEINENFSTNGVRIYQVGNANNIIIGANCLFSDGIEIWASDAHNIYDMSSKGRVNHEKDIIVEDHVWVGHGVSLLKGITIGSGAMVGLKSVVTEDVPRNSVVVTEQKQRIVRENVYWEG